MEADLRQALDGQELPRGLRHVWLPRGEELQRQSVQVRRLRGVQLAGLWPCLVVELALQWPGPLLSPQQVIILSNLGLAATVRKLRNRSI